MIKLLFAMFVGVAGGIAVGAGYVAFLTVLGVIPRLTQLSKTMKMIRSYELAVVIGAVAGTLAILQEPHFHLTPLLLIIFGLAGGIFIGMLAGALTEVLNVWPILAKRIGMEERLILLLMALALGKIFGSLFQWIYFVSI